MQIKNYQPNRSPAKTGRVGIYAGNFDPVHLGHITFALQTLEIARLDKIIFLPERQPQFDGALAHFGHRAAMISRAIRPYPRFYSLELPDAYLSAELTLPKLRRSFPGAELVLMQSSDACPDRQLKPKILNFSSNFELAIGISPGRPAPDLAWTKKFSTHRINLIEEILPPVDLQAIRGALLSGNSAVGVLASVRRYAARNWLYASFVSLKG